MASPENETLDCGMPRFLGAWVFGQFLAGIGIFSLLFGASDYLINLLVLGLPRIRMFSPQSFHFALLGVQAIGLGMVLICASRQYPSDR